MKNIKFNIWGLVLFLIIMIPNFIWFVIPSQNDILRSESVTPVIDCFATIFQVIMIIGLCLISSREKQRISKISILMLILYFICWILYYCNVVNSIVILGLCIFPCLSFIFYEMKNKNWITLIPTILFTILHLLYGIINFL